MSMNDAPRRGLDLTFGTSFLATMAVAVSPSFISFGFLVWSRPDPHPVLATIVSIVATIAAFIAGTKVWENQPESQGCAFADLMLWHWVRREWAEEKLIRNARLLGYDREGRFVGKVEISSERQLFAARQIGAALDAKSSYTLNHSKRVEKHVRDIAAEIGLTSKTTEELATAAALHDIGNIRIPEHVIRKAGELTIEERSTVEGHVVLGALMAFEAGGERVMQGLRHHHERWDGKGYPSGLMGSEIPLFARIIGIAESYDAMTSTRPYRQSLTQDQAISILRDEAGTQFDPRLVEVFAATLPEPLQIIERVPALAWAQRQLRELSILFRRVGGTAISAAASTIAIALILGTALLKPDVFSGGGDGSGGTRPERPAFAAQGNEQSHSTEDVIALAAASEEAALVSEGIAPEDRAAEPRGSERIEDEVLGERIRVDGHQGGGHGGPGGGGNGDHNGNGGGGSTDGPSTEEPGGGDPGTDPDIEEPGGGGSGGGGSQPPVVDPEPERPGNSGNAPGHNKGDKGGKPEWAGGGKGGGHDKPDKDTGKPEWAGGGKGGGHDKPDKDTGRPDWAGGGNDGGGAKPDKDTGKPDWAGESGNDNGSNAGGNGNGPSDAPGQSGDAGNSDSSNGKKDGWAESEANESKGNGNGNGASDSSGGSSDGDSGPGNSGSSGSSSSPGNSGSNGNGSDKSSSDSSPGNSGSSSASDKSSADSSPGNSASNGKDTNGADV